MEYYVYEHWLDGKCFYVGKGHGNRAYNLNKGRRNKDWEKFFDGRKDEVKVVIVKTFENEGESYEFEREHSLKRKEEGYPLTNKADGFSIYGEDNPFYNKKHSKETIMKISRKNKGKEAWNKGKSASEEQKRKQSEKMLGRKQTIEHTLKKSKSMTGKIKHSDETREKISKNTKPGKGGKVTQYKVRCIDTGKIYDNLQRAQEDTGAAVSNIRKVILGQRKIAGGLRWEKVD